MKKEYTAPMATSETFEANEYVAVCYGIGCLGGNPGVAESTYDVSKWKGTAGYGSNCQDHSGSCQSVLNNRILDGNQLQENNSEQGWIPGAIDSFDDLNGNGAIDAGELVFWHTTSTSGDRRWNHAGYAVNVDESHPHHS